MELQRRKVVIIGAGHVGSHAGYALLSAEVSAQGRTVLSAQFSDFTMEMMNPNDAGDSA